MVALECVRQSRKCKESGAKAGKTGDRECSYKISRCSRTPTEI